ncbi:MAG: tRNA (N6-threonylcarbamoyladenosine(37)-N6)-methyltransferase TrmO [Neisseriaceae bacterium]|nr:tRNA (N6-threonylcarbamoyladenosine(37)-N6)-methyltransferase TrmO [Neisseriaceae bacterium]MBP6863133.1 tRNA (N6-threonylcarbamoyladenosine(37)-N6)-methyltransferase TrmO [Neisseriaceae bacterium]
MQLTINTIGVIESPYQQKFGIARQPGLVDAAKVWLVLAPEFTEESVRGLAGFDYVWVHFVFHAAIKDGWSPLVRPPRLGGKQKMGVFATRSPHRPNHLGLSLLRLETVDTHKGVRLLLSGADLLDGTPVIDIKPYIPFVEAKPDARSGFVLGTPPLLSVIWSEGALSQLQDYGLDQGFKDLVSQSVAQDPRPAYQEDAQRVYGMLLAGVNVSFQVQGEAATIVALSQA